MWILSALWVAQWLLSICSRVSGVLSLAVPLGTFNRYASQPELNCSCKLLTKQPCPGFCIRGKINYLTPPLHFTVHFQHAGANYIQQKDYSLYHSHDDLHLAAPHGALLMHQLQALVPRRSVLMHWLPTLSPHRAHKYSSWEAVPQPHTSNYGASQLGGELHRVQCTEWTPLTVWQP